VNKEEAMSEEGQTTVPAAPADQSGLLPLVTAAAAIAAALVALIALFLLISVANDVASLHSQTRKLSHAVEAVEEQVAQLKAAAAPALRPAEKPAQAPRPTHIDAGDAAADCIVRPGSKNPLADCLK
jgi:hypothetical protein